MAPVADRIELAFSFPKVSMRRKAIVNLKMLSFMTPKDCAMLRQDNEYLPDEEKDGIFAKKNFKKRMRIENPSVPRLYTR